MTLFYSIVFKWQINFNIPKLKDNFKFFIKENKSTIRVESVLSGPVRFFMKVRENH